MINIKALMSSYNLNEAYISHSHAGTDFHQN